MPHDWDYVENIAARLALKHGRSYEWVLENLLDAIDKGELEAVQMRVKDLEMQNRDEN